MFSCILVSVQGHLLEPLHQLFTCLSDTFFQCLALSDPFSYHVVARSTSTSSCQFSIVGVSGVYSRLVVKYLYTSV